MADNNTAHTVLRLLTAMLDDRNARAHSDLQLSCKLLNQPAYCILLLL